MYRLRYISTVSFIFLALFTIVIPGFAQEEDSEACNTRTCTTTESASEFGLSEAEINAFALPDYEQLTVNPELLHDRRYMQVTGDMNVYDAPGGNVTRSLDGGFNYMTTINAQNDWVEINPGEWVNGAQLAPANHVVSHFTGIFLPDEFPKHTPAWLLVNLYPSSKPEGDPVESNGLLYRYSLVHIFDEVRGEDGWKWYQIGADKWVHQTHVSRVLPIEQPDEVETDLWVGVDLYEQNLIVYEDGKPIFATLISSGLPRWPTFEGTFNIYYRRTRHDMSWGTPGDDFYYLEEVPWTMFFDEGRALHGAYWHDGLGYRRSHGCVNMSITDANWLYHRVAEDFGKLNSPDVEEGPAVHVYSSGEYR